MSVIRYENTTPPHNKYWEIVTAGTTVMISWGRIGAEAQNQVKHLSNLSEVNEFVNKKVQEKEKKGYYRV